MPIDLTPYTSFSTSASASALLVLNELAQLSELSHQILPMIILGSGSNVLFADDYVGTVVINRLMGRTVVDETAENVRINLGAGENWHDVVCDMSARGFYGLENLALIPGTVGAAPVQNIGAYGVEVANFVESVELFDLQTNETVVFNVNACEFGYRDSVFKRPENRHRYVIISVVLQLSKQFSPVLSYQGLAEVNGDAPLNAETLLSRVIAVRQSKLPDPNVLPNAGSFFKNPMVNCEKLAELQEIYPKIPFFDVDEKQVKIPAAWLLETLGFKGEQRENGTGVYEKHALILVNRGGARGKDIYALAKDMMYKVHSQFGIDIVPEVRIVGL